MSDTKPMSVEGVGLFMLGVIINLFQLMLLVFIGFTNDTVKGSHVLLIAWGMIVGAALMVGGVATGQRAKRGGG